MILRKLIGQGHTPLAACAPPTQADLDWLRDKAHRECFIANAVTTEVSVVPA